MPRKTPPCEVYPAWTTARFWTFVRSALRVASNKWPPKYEVVNEARRPNESKNKRLRWEYQCNSCKDWFPQKETSVDHKIPVGTLKDYDDLPGFVRRLFCPKEELQVLCKECHDTKTQEEKAK